MGLAVRGGAKVGHWTTPSSPFLKGGPSLGVGTTQLHNKTVVYNHKRHGKFALGGRTYDFRMKPAVPKKLSREFLLVDLVNNLDQLGEDPRGIWSGSRIACPRATRRA
ncbi:hypothetical protein [Caulobacter sp. DWP3-1-3b2]|uniref:hypothetical protein n=1 Tax=Caulobacter sp. DWP3-1-3b2 TaxID=2804643 RepID=UPI003CEA3677